MLVLSTEQVASTEMVTREYGHAFYCISNTNT